MEVKCRYYKEKLREWSAYSKERYPVENQPQQHKSIRPSETGASRIEGKQLRASSAPTSFITSNGASDPPAPRATSLRAFFNPGDRDQRSWEQLNQQTAEPWQPNCGRTSTLEVDSSVETSDETEDVLGASSRLVGKASISSQAQKNRKLLKVVLQS